MSEIATEEMQVAMECLRYGSGHGRRTAANLGVEWGRCCAAYNALAGSRISVEGVRECMQFAGLSETERALLGAVLAELSL